MPGARRGGDDGTPPPCCDLPFTNTHPQGEEERCGGERVCPTSLQLKSHRGDSPRWSRLQSAERSASIRGSEQKTRDFD